MSALPPLPPSAINFSQPPVAEVALAVQLTQPVTDDTLTLSSFWPQIQGDYPHLEPQAPLAPMGEDFEGAGPPPISFQLLDRPPAGRYWFLSDDRAELVQVQPDRFAFNWRKEDQAGDYPRYERLRERFFAVYTKFVETCSAHGRDVLPSWCEVTYINPIEVETANGWPDLSTVLRRIQPLELSRLSLPEDSTLNERYRLQRDGEPYGRFYVTAAPARRLTDNTPLVVLTLVARGLAPQPNTEGVVAFLDEGRDLIVQSFKDMTTDEMHVRWGLDEPS